MAISLSEVLADPAGAAARLLAPAGMYAVLRAEARRGCGEAAVLDLTLRPLPPFADEGYPVELVRIVVLTDHEIHAFPRDQHPRRYKHRNLLPMSDLCLQYPHDDPALRWLPDDGLEALVMLVHRHLIFEERWRRTGQWPTEDAPHGDSGPLPHPIATPGLRKELARWKRSARLLPATA
jgi:hypothetical protein